MILTKLSPFQLLKLYGKKNGINKATMAINCMKKIAVSMWRGVRPKAMGFLSLLIICAVVSIETSVLPILRRNPSA
jgi:hypothetical protein